MTEAGRNINLKFRAVGSSTQAFRHSFAVRTVGEAALFYSPVDFTDASDMHHSNSCLMHRWINRWIKQRSQTGTRFRVPSRVVEQSTATSFKAELSRLTSAAYAPQSANPPPPIRAILREEDCKLFIRISIRVFVMPWPLVLRWMKRPLIRQSGSSI